MGMSLVRGQNLPDAGQPSGAPLAVISEDMARRFWPNDDAVGHRIRHRGSTEWLTIAGVVSDWRYGGPTSEPEPTIYTWRDLSQWSWMFVVARLRAEPASVVRGTRRVLRDMDPSLPLTRIWLMDGLLASTLAMQRLVTGLLTAFGLLAVLLAALGLYGVLAQSVALRTQEIGVRVTLGATRAQVLRTVLGRGLLLAGSGMALGLGVAAVFSRALRSLLYGVSPLDPVAFADVVILLWAVSLLASWLPARRAAQVDPVAALRSE